MALINSTQLAQKLNVSQAAITKAVKSGRLEYVDPSKKLFDEEEALAQWGELHAKPSDKGTIGQALLREKQARASLLEIEVKKTAGELVEVAEIERHWGRALADLRNAFLSIPERLASLVRTARTDAEADKMIRDEIHRVLEQVSELHA